MQTVASIAFRLKREEVAGCLSTR